jgi:glycosyltransferase involved in cell wall biosynthesis
MTVTLVTIVIPYFNKGDLIDRAIAGVAAQSWKDFELIVVDDGSNDLPDTKVSLLASSFDASRFRLIRHARNYGAATARNTGIQAANGTLIAFLDADDCWKPEKLGAQVSMAQQFGPQFVASCTGFYIHRGNAVSRVDYTSKPRRKIAEEVLWGCNISPGSTMLVNRHVFETIGFFDHGLRRLEDWDWLLRFSQRYEMTFVPMPLADIFINETNPSRGDLQQDQTLQAIAIIGERHLKQIRRRGWWASNKFRSALLIERAARMHKLGKPGRAMIYVATALVFYPLRNLNFFSMLWRSVRKLLTSSGA